MAVHLRAAADIVRSNMSEALVYSMNNIVYKHRVIEKLFRILIEPRSLLPQNLPCELAEEAVWRNGPQPHKAKSSERRHSTALSADRGTVLERIPDVRDLDGSLRRRYDSRPGAERRASWQAVP